MIGGQARNNVAFYATRHNQFYRNYRKGVKMREFRFVIKTLDGAFDIIVEDTALVGAVDKVQSIIRQAAAGWCILTVIGGK
jgi:hypothetical protein